MRIEILAQSEGNETPDWAVMGEDGSMAVFTRIVSSVGQTFDSTGWVLARVNGGILLLRYGAIDPSNPGNTGVSFHEATREFLEAEIRASRFEALQWTLDAEAEQAAPHAQRNAALRAALIELTAAG